jgi:hypothetical protein
MAATERRSGDHRDLHPVAAGRAGRLLSAYSGEHAVYGIVLVTALIGVGWEDDTDLEVLIFVLGTVVVFWLAHVYASAVASRSRRPPPSLRESIREGMRHTSGMVVAMVVPAALLLTGVMGVVDEDTAYVYALGSGVVLLALIGFGNGVRNGSSWLWCTAGALSTTCLGLLVIGLSVAVH